MLKKIQCQVNEELKENEVLKTMDISCSVFREILHEVHCKFKYN